MSSRHAQRSGITETQWQQQVTDLATLRGWTWYHTHDSRRSPAGFPDLVLVRGDRLIFAELKREGEKPTAKQADWLAKLDAAGVETHVWRPTDLAGVIASLS